MSYEGEAPMMALVDSYKEGESPELACLLSLNMDVLFHVLQQEGPHLMLQRCWNQALRLSRLQNHELNKPLFLRNVSGLGIFAIATENELLIDLPGRQRKT
jgi:hypothetical protein